MQFAFKLSLSICFLGLSACQSGLSGLVNTHSVQLNPSQNQTTGQSQISPRTKGSTLTGIVVWPQEATPLNDLRFEIQAITPAKTWKTQSSPQGQFKLENLEWQTNSAPLRMEAKALANPHLMFKCLYLPQIAAAEPQTMEMTLTSTAIVALLDQARNMNSQIMLLSPARLSQSDTRPLVESIKNSMMPYFNASLKAPLETMPEVSVMLDQAVKKLETMPGMLP
ncbi:MAG: hypothetical protein AB7I41_09530 [Candidatus Sericytochromatia bacterium]